MARPPHKLKKEKLVEGVSGLRTLQDLGVKIHKLKHIKLHAKLILADDARAIVGSINLAPGSFDSRRELAIEVDDQHIIHRIKRRSITTGPTPIRLISPTRRFSPNLKTMTPTVKEDLAISIKGHDENGKHHKDQKRRADEKHQDGRKVSQKLVRPS